MLTEDTRPFVQDTTTVIPEPFDLMPWLTEHAAEIATGAGISLFGDQHPDKEISVMIYGGGADGSVQAAPAWKGDTWIFQLKGSAAVSLNGADATNSQQLLEKWGGIVPANTPYKVTRASNSISMVVTQDPLGNKPGGATEAAAKKQRLS